MKKSAIVPSLLLATASLFFLYSRVPIYMFPGELIRPVVIFWSVLFLLLLPAYWTTQNWDWAGFILVVVVLGLFSSTLFAYVYSIAVVTIFLLLSAMYSLVLKKNMRSRHIYLVLNGVSSAAILLSLFSLYPLFSTIPTSYYSNTWDMVKSKKYVELDPGIGAKPDIYFIVLDGYGRSDILQQLYDFDNSEFLSYLEKKGFTVPGKSRANYPKTVLSIASTLNIDYIDAFAPDLDSSSLWWLMSPWLDHNLVRASLERIGYSSVAISTNWSITDNPTTDYYFKSHPIILSEFDRYILSTTPLKTFLPYIQNIASVPNFDAHRRSQLKAFDGLINSTTVPGPKFVFAHIILPHPPFVFSSEGTPINPDHSYTLNDADAPSFYETSEQYREHYVDQALFLNSRLELVVDYILHNSHRPPVIILQADHGPRLLSDALSIEKTCIAEGISTFSAYYLPGLPPNIVPDDISSVNIFRLIFNVYFDANLSLLMNAQYYPRQGASLYHFEDVTYRADHPEHCTLK